MEAIRAQLGVEKVTLFGISYGTELAIAYARAYPQHVERLILDSVVDPDDPDPFFTAGSAPWARRCSRCARAGCRGISDEPGRGPRAAGRAAARQADGPLAYDERGRSHRSRSRRRSCST